MTERVLLVDYENIQAVELKALPNDVKVRFILGGKQQSLLTSIAVPAQAYVGSMRTEAQMQLTIKRSGSNC